MHSLVDIKSVNILFCIFQLYYEFYIILEGAARYAGLLLAPAEGFGLQPRTFFALWAKKGSFYVCFGPNLGIFGDQY